MFSGPVIRDVTHDLNEDIASFPSNIEQPKTPAAPTQASTSSSSVVAVDPKLIQHGDGSSSGGGAPQVVKTSANKRPVLTRELSREDLDEDVNKVRTYGCAFIKHVSSTQNASAIHFPDGSELLADLNILLCSIYRFTTTLST